MDIKIKEHIQNYINKTLDQKINTVQQAIEFAKESRDSDTKSSVGDKYETSRAMMHLELEKNQGQLANLLTQKSDLAQVRVEQISDEVGFGSLVRTKQGIYFVAIGIGKVVLDKNVYYAISLASPLGKAIKGKKLGENFSFNGRSFEILELY